MSSLRSGSDISVKCLKLINAFRYRGHFNSRINPLLETSNENIDRSMINAIISRSSYHRMCDVVKLLQNYPHNIDLQPFNMDEKDLDQKLDLNIINQEFHTTKNSLTLRELIDQLTKIYCGTVGVEYQQISNDYQRHWLETKIEKEYGKTQWKIASQEQRLKILNSLLRTDHTALFLQKYFPASKVFGLEGCESLVPGLLSLVESAASEGVIAIELGMAHRGRMNILHNFLGKPLSNICGYFSETLDSELGDVKYHLGTRTEIEVETSNGKKKVLLSLSANPSHLEHVNPVVLGKCRAMQFFINDTECSKVLPLLIHGDAAFCGQGIVAEAMELSELLDYSVGGTIHVVVNNNIGFTTIPSQARTSYYPTNVAKGVEAPILHVNGDDPEAVCNVFKLAVSFRQKFKKDIVIDLQCYRRHGHNSLDDPTVTLPILQRLITGHPPTLQVYAKKLIQEKAITSSEYEGLSRSVELEYEQEYKKSKDYKKDPLEWLASNWQGSAIGNLLSRRPYNQTGVRLSTLLSVGHSLLKTPDDFVLHKDIQKLFKQRRNTLETGENCTWAFAEALAIGCLLKKYSPSSEKGLRGLAMNKRTLNETNAAFTSTLDVELQEHPTVYVRLSGQDCKRGTFSQRYTEIICQNTGRSYTQLNNLGSEEQALLTVCNSSLSESAVLGYEYGYSLSNEMALTIWEAQFGDFANVATSIIDQFIASGEYKWNLKSSLVVLLPHGLEGQGPDHSSGRIERFLSLVDDDEDIIPGNNQSAFFQAEMEQGFKSMVDGSNNGIDYINKQSFHKAILRYAPHLTTERIDLAIAEILSDLQITDGINNSQGGNDIMITKETWIKLMKSWLQLNSERKINLIVCNPSTPAQYFHVLRRQIHRPYAKPLILFSCKSMLHHKHCVSKLEDMLEGTYFQRVIVENGKGDNMKSYELVSPEQMRKVIFCSGKIFYSLYSSRQSRGIKDITIVRVEQLAPFPFDILQSVIKKYSNAELVWVQEEPKNMGGWSYVKPRFDTSMREASINKTIKYLGRPPAAASASGSFKVHVQEQKELINNALL